MNREDIYRYKSLNQVAKEECMALVTRLLVVDKTEEEFKDIPCLLSDDPPEEMVININAMLFWGNEMKAIKEIRDKQEYWAKKGKQHEAKYKQFDRAGVR